MMAGRGERMGLGNGTLTSADLVWGRHMTLMDWPEAHAHLQLEGRESEGRRGEARGGEVRGREWRRENDS